MGRCLQAASPFAKSICHDYQEMKGEGEHPVVKRVRVQVGETSLLCRLTARSFDVLELAAGKPV